MLLTIDIGNTNITMGLFQKETLKARWRIATDARRMADEYQALLQGLLQVKDFARTDIRGVALCSVVPPLTAVFEELAKEYFRSAPLVVSAGVKTGIRILYESPRDVGTDRVVDAAAALHLYGGPVVVVDFGTAVVFDAVTKEGDYLGGAILPGLSVAAEALFLNTSQLRRVELQRPKSAIGRNTVASIQSGLIFGYVALVEGMVKRFREELGQEAHAVATGGQASIIARETTIFNTVNPDLTLVGLRLIYEMNQ
ncbi:MAG: type III pantothenate kinase [Chloroflexi bacterium]|nr:type III pantothenate kinase [Chloroflexota bacterium]